MLKPKKIDLEDTNVALLDSQLAKDVRAAAAATEAAWDQAGKKCGLEIWRIEKFKVVHWPKERYGEFYSGDSYIVLKTNWKKDENGKPIEGGALAWDVHFWLGEFTTQDEAGTAAYKTVELDDLLGTEPVQHREVMGYESDLFLSYFNNKIKILDGGVDSGFKHVEPEKYNPRLMHLKGKRKVRVQQCDMAASSMNHGDVFILDAGLKIYQWNGAKAGPMEKMKGASTCAEILEDRKGRAQKFVLEDDESDQSAPAQEFWKYLDNKRSDVLSAEAGGSDAEAENAPKVRKLYRSSDASGKLEFKLESEGKIMMNMFDTKDAFVMDVGKEVFVWVGKGASKQERATALNQASTYLKQNGRPQHTPIARVSEGGEPMSFKNYLDKK